MMAEQEVWTTLKVLAWTKEFLLAKGIVNARLEAEWLLCAVTGLDRVGLYLQYDKPLNESELAEYRAKVARRAKREPLQHILGSEEFCGLEYEVTADVLIPRHDTEVLVSEAFARNPGAATILDIGTGSGCIAVSLQKLFTNAAVTATDISEAALVVARRNAERHGVEIEFLAGSLFAPVAGRRYDLVVSNPPYIPSADIESLDQEVRDYDPRSALDGGKDGLDIYRALIPSSVDFLNPGGWLLVEVGIGQAEEVVRLFRNSGGFREPVVTCDHGRIERTVGAQLKETP
ncbi:MAG: peptide chain release factor N(5)-glutamine methyltransferase [Desulfuromonadaceae bacterium]|nr:peptide chain release factor N(5)-glutamine methyltransferase [Desulfuromonadaceae bacterium]